MNVRIPKNKDEIIFKKPHYRNDFREEVLVHGAFHYQCEKCRHIFRMWLEDGVEGNNKKQPSPFIIPCPECGGESSHVFWHTDIHLDELTPLWKDAHFFAFDKSGKDNACGKPSIYIGKENINEST